MLLLIDGNNLAWAGYYALERAMKPEDDDRRRRVAMLGLASMTLGSIARAGEPPGVRGGTPATHVAVCFDRGRPIRRRTIYPGYQAARDDNAKFAANEPFILSAIDAFAEMAAAMLPVDILRGDDTEADDLIAGLAHRHEGAPKRIISTDRDFMQLIGPATSIYAPVKKLVVDERSFFDAISLKPPPGAAAPFPRERYLDFRALTGDPSDNLPGVPGIGALSAVRLLARAPLDEYFDAPAAVRGALGRANDAVERAFADGSARAVVGRNRCLMDLRLPAPCWDQLDAFTARGTWDRAAFKSWYDEQRISAVEEAALFDRLETLANSGTALTAHQ